MFLGFIIDLPFVALLGALILMGVGMTMLNTEIELKTGEVTNITYNGSTATSLTSSYEYQTYDFGAIGSSSYGWIITILGALLFVIFIFKSGD